MLVECWLNVMACLRRQKKTSKFIYPMREKNCTPNQSVNSDPMIDTGASCVLGWLRYLISYQGYPPPTTFLQRTSSQITTSTSLHTYSICPHVDTTQTSSLTLLPKKGRGCRLQLCPRLPRRRLLCSFQKHVCAHERFSWLSARPLRIEDRYRANPAQGRMAST